MNNNHRNNSYDYFADSADSGRRDFNSYNSPDDRKNVGNTVQSFDGNKGKKSTRTIRIAAIAFAMLLLVVNVVFAVYSSVMSGMTMYSQSEIEDSRVTGEELERLDAEFASDDVSGSDVDSGLPTDYVVSTDEVSLMLLIGSDSRFGIDSEARSDSMMIIAIDRTHKKIKIVSLMRDLFAIIPDYKNDRINKAFYYDSRYKNLDLKITRATIEHNLGIAIDDFVIIDFTGFKEVIDLLGGVKLTLSDTEAKYMCSDEKYGLFPRFKAGGGEYVLNGAEALNYCRMRKVAGGDFGRTERQRKALAQIVSQLKSSGLTDLYNVATSCTKYVSTNIPMEEINGYVMEALDILSYDIVQLRLPIEGSYVQSRVYMGKSPMSVLWPNYKWNAEQLRKFIFEDDLTWCDTSKKADIKIPYLPYGTVTSLEEEEVTTDTTSSETGTDDTSTTADTSATSTQKTTSSAGGNTTASTATSAVETTTASTAAATTTTTTTAATASPTPSEE